MANPRKFSEKIALHNQKQAEETAAFERIMQEVSVTRVVPPIPGVQPPRLGTHLQPHSHPYMRPYLGGSLPNVNQITANPQMELHQPMEFDDGKHMIRHPGRFDSRMRPYGFHHRRGMPLELTNKHRVGHPDGQPGQYAGPYLSPPPESNWRRTNSDSALHQSVMNPNPQDAFNPSNLMINQGRRDFNENSFHNMPPYKVMMDKKMEQHLQAGNRPKSCETTPNMSLHASGESSNVRVVEDGSSLPLSGNGTAPSISHGLSHVTQIGNNTGSLPDLTNLANIHIPSQLSNPIDYDDAQSHSPNQQVPGGQNSDPYHQSRGSSNLPTAPAISPHLSGMSRGPASPNRSRRHTHNGPSPLSLASPEHSRRMKHPSASSPKVGAKPELKSPPIAGNYPYPYPGTQGTNWSQPSSDHPSSPSHGQAMSPHGVPQGSELGMHSQQINHQQPGGPLRIDVSAASKVGQQMSPYSRAPQGASATSPITSPTSPTSHCGQTFSPVTSPRHEFTTGSNPALSEAYYRSEASAMHPLQQQFEQFHVVGDSGSPHHSSAAPPMYSSLTPLSASSTDRRYGSHGHGILKGAQEMHGRLPNNLTKIPDIVFTGADDAHSSKPGDHESNDFRSVLSHDLGSEYFTSEDLKANLGIEGLQMLEESNIINDPAMEDSLRLDSM